MVPVVVAAAVAAVVVLSSLTLHTRLPIENLFCQVAKYHKYHTQAQYLSYG
jgi:hypothetical protein